MMLIANAYGVRKAERFRARFCLPAIGKFYDQYGVSGDAHDYLHTLTGTLPGPISDEAIVLQVEESILRGSVPMPRGLELVK